MVSRMLYGLVLCLTWYTASTYRYLPSAGRVLGRIQSKDQIYSSKHMQPKPHDTNPRQQSPSNILKEKLKGLGKQLLSVTCAIGIMSSSNVQNVLAKDTPSYPVFNEVWTLVRDNFFDSTYNTHDWESVRQEYFNKLTKGEVDEQKAIKDMLGLLGDKYSRLLDKNTYEALWKYDAIGVGLLFQSDANGHMYVSAPPLRGSSGEKAGIHEGDVVYSINGISTTSMTAMQLLDIMSNDEGTSLTIDLANSKEDTASRRTLQLVRNKVEVVNPVTYQIQKLKNGKTIGYIRMKEFNSKVVPGMREALDAVNPKVDEIVVDLRGNTGGGFQFALNIGGMFMNDKLMVSASGKGMPESTFKTSYPDGVLSDKPLILVTDGLSASASEVLTAGLHENCRAAVIGSKTFGKGKIQAVFGLTDGEGLTLTVAQYLSPRGNVIQSKGIEPDLPVNTANPYVSYLVDTVAGNGGIGLDLNRIDLELALNKMQALCPAS